MPSPLSGPIGSLADRRRAEILEIAREEGVSHVAVFGSAARGEDNDDSDLDVLIVMDPGRSLFDLIAFQRRVGELLGVRVDAATRGMLKQRMRSSVEAEAVSPLMPRRDVDRLLDVLDAIDAVARYQQALDDGFPMPEAIRDGILYRLLQVGEAARAMSERTRQVSPELPGADMVGMRDRLAHECFGVDQDLVDVVVQLELRRIRPVVEGLLRTLETE